jgi:hypothetical protein
MGGLREIAGCRLGYPPGVSAGQDDDLDQLVGQDSVSDPDPCSFGGVARLAAKRGHALPDRAERDRLNEHRKFSRHGPSVMLTGR